jgi:hypothetical protein
VTPDDRPVTARSGGFVRAYGARPLHLLALLASFGLAGYAVLRTLHTPHGVQILVWFVGAVIGHDVVLFPLYSLADAGLQRVPGRGARPTVPWINYVRVPAAISGLLFLLWFPLILGLAEPTYRAASGLGTAPFLGRWLLVTGVAFALSAVSYALRLRRASVAMATAASAAP